MVKKGVIAISILSAVLLVIFILGVIFFGSILQSGLIFDFSQGFLPYGESPNMITGIGSVCSASSCNGKYWDVDLTSTDSRFANTRLEGNDFDLVVKASSGDGTLITTEDFSKKDFKAELQLDIGSCTRNPCTGGDGSLNVFLLSPDEEQGILSIDVVGSGSLSGVLEIKSSPITNKVIVFWEGQKVDELTLTGEYKIKIKASMDSAWQSGTSQSDKGISTFTIIKPSFKEQFGCTKEPGEQFYLQIFNEGDSVNINKLDNFNKFCLEEAPLKIFSNIGSTTDEEVLEGLVNDEQFVVPLGQVWSIEYIGDLTVFKTECEANELFNDNENVCMARTVVSLRCAEGSEFNFGRGICVVETEPTEFEPTDIGTHQDLQSSGNFRITHAFDLSRDFSTPNSIKIGEDTFSSKGLTYSGFLGTNVDYPDDFQNWNVGFSFSGKNFDTNLDEKIILNDFFSVKVTDLKGSWKADGRFIEDYEIDYTFDANIDFFDLSYSNGEITVVNNYQSIEGGLVVTTINNIGGTSVETINQNLMLGSNIFKIDTTNILEIKARPFIKIDTSEFEYRLDGIKAISIDLDDEITNIVEGGGTRDGGFELTNFILMISVALVVLFIAIILVILLRKK